MYPFKLLKRAVFVLVGLFLIYWGFTIVQVANFSSQDNAGGASTGGTGGSIAIIVIGGGGVSGGLPDADLGARLDQAIHLYQQGEIIIVTGGSSAGHGEKVADVAAKYVVAHNIDGAAVREVGGDDAWHSLALAAKLTKSLNINTAILVSDPYQALEMSEMAGDYGLHAFSSPTRTSPVAGGAVFGDYLKSSLAVAFGRVIGFGPVDWVHRLL